MSLRSSRAIHGSAAIIIFIIYYLSAMAGPAADLDLLFANTNSNTINNNRVSIWHLHYSLHNILA